MCRRSTFVAWESNFATPSDHSIYGRGVWVSMFKSLARLSDCMRTSLRSGQSLSCLAVTHYSSRYQEDTGNPKVPQWPARSGVPQRSSERTFRQIFPLATVPKLWKLKIWWLYVVLYYDDFFFFYIIVLIMDELNIAKSIASFRTTLFLKRSALKWIFYCYYFTHMSLNSLDHAKLGHTI